MRTRRLRWVAAGLAVLFIAGVFALWPQPDRVTLENFNRIQEGMTRAEVEAILGGRPGDFLVCFAKDGSAKLCYYGRSRPGESRGYWRLEPECSKFQANWLGIEGCITVIFESEVVARPTLLTPVRVGSFGTGLPNIIPTKFFDRTIRRGQNHLDDLLWRAKQQWRNWFG